MTDVVARLRQLEAAATPGEWLASHYAGEFAFETRREDAGHITIKALGSSDRWSEDDAALLVAARNALPQLLAIAEAARRLSRHAANPLNCDCPRIGSLIEHVHEIEAALAALDSQETE